MLLSSTPYMKPIRTRPYRHPARGTTLIEALVALLVMAFGMVALVGLMSNLRRSADGAKQRGEALRIAQAELSQIRSFSILTQPAVPVAGTAAFDDITQPAAATTITPANTNTTYSLERLVTDVTEAAGNTIAKQVRVNVTWLDRAGQNQSLTLESYISRVDPAFAGALAIAPTTDNVRRPAERSPVIPTNAKDLGGKQSGFKPASGGSVAWVFNNLTGSVTKLCTVDQIKNTSDLVTADLSDCTTISGGYLVSGTVSFSTTTPPNPAAPAADAMAIQIGISLTSTGHPEPAYSCFDDSAAAISAVPKLKVVNYYCLVYGNAASPPIWSGTVRPSLLVNDPLYAQFRACRYTADYNGDGRIGNSEHPLAYTAVSSSLARQNFLITGGATCPTAAATNPASGIFADYSTQEVPAPAAKR